METVYSDTLGFEPVSVQTVGSGASATVQIRSETLNASQINDLQSALFDEFQPKDKNGNPSAQAISFADVSETWGGQITKKALIALIVFLVIVSIYIAIRFERDMAVAAIVALFFDIIVTAGVYSLVGFEVTPATVIGLLTILGFSLYDTVVVFDKVEENTRGVLHLTRRTYGEQANLAVNQTLMRSINTTVISVLPVIALMVVAVWMLGVGTLKDLALVQLVGIIVGAYSSIFFATPLLVSMKERWGPVAAHTRKVLSRRATLAEKGTQTVAVGAPVARRAPVAPQAGCAADRKAKQEGALNMLPRTRTLVRSMTFVAATAVAAGSLAACSESAEQVPSIGYAIDNSISTYNANTTAGSVSGAMAAFGRVLPGFTFTGPAGAPVSDTDIGTASELPGDVLTVSYKLNPASVYSDGIPMSCDDLVLTWAASSGKFTEDVDGAVKPMFDTANNLGYADIDRIDCQSGGEGRDGVLQTRAIVHRLAVVVRCDCVDAFTRRDAAHGCQRRGERGECR